MRSVKAFRHWHVRQPEVGNTALVRILLEEWALAWLQRLQLLQEAAETCISPMQLLQTRLK